MIESRQLSELTRSESLRLLCTVPFGRVVFTHRALPAIRPVNHLLDGEHIIIRTSALSAISSDLDGSGAVVGFEADSIDAEVQLGWSVVAVGWARRIKDESLRAKYRQMLRPWVTGDRDDVISVSTDMVTGYRLVPLLLAAGASEISDPVP